MDIETIALIGSEYIQLGFAGLCILLIGVIVWLVYQLLEVLKGTTKALSENTNAIHTLIKAVDDQKAITSELRDEFYKRPCISERR